LAAIVALVYMFTQNQWHWVWISMLATIFVTIVCVNIGLHRYVSHASFKTGTLRAKFLIYSTVIAAFGSPLSWVAMHRYHHAKSGSAQDNQSPKNIGYVRAWLTLYDPITVPPAMVKDIIRNHDCMFIHRHYFTLLTAYVLILFVINPLLPVFAFCIPAAMCYQAAGAFAVIPHDARFGGYQVMPSRGQDDSVNSPLASILSLGEGWHNYHHTVPSDHRHGHKWWEIDPPAWIIERFFKI